MAIIEYIKMNFSKRKNEKTRKQNFSKTLNEIINIDLSKNIKPRDNKYLSQIREINENINKMNLEKLKNSYSEIRTSILEYDSNNSIYVYKTLINLRNELKDKIIFKIEENYDRNILTLDDIKYIIMLGDMKTLIKYKNYLENSKKKNTVILNFANKKIETAKTKVYEIKRAS